MDPDQPAPSETASEGASSARRRRSRKTDDKPRESSALHDRIGHRTAARTRRVVTFLLGIWCGGLLLVALVAPSSFMAADTVLSMPPPALETVVKNTNPDLAREVLRYQVAEVNRVVFTIWGWLQGVVALAVLLLLVFLSNVNRLTVGIAAAMTVLAGVMNFFLIPRIAVITRTAATMAKDKATAGTDMFAILHGGFAAFQLALVVMIAALLFLLFRSRRTSQDTTLPQR
ncbi:MAG: hypothetical protein M9913_00510 [Bryobacteraceae bacterium]|nr:hypothetical protein [Solibacteraceae bacterium]MCO5349386.1 hypothetical protein [Bryobacteraceae bacterium]